MRRKTALGLAFLLASCALLSPRPDRSHFFVLTPLAPGDGTLPARRASRALAVGVGPINVPRYLDRPEVVKRVAPNELKPTDGDRWAEPLDIQIRSILLINLGTLLGSDRVLSFPWYGGATLDYVVTVDVYAFERNAERGADLVAHWLVKDGRKGTVLRAEEARLSEATASEKTADVVAALSRALGELSRTIAGAIDGLGAEPVRPR